jgi:NTP pyrophosphatase (non-canonical NTP hydrolase)
MNKDQIKELMVITAEECGELTQACCKIYRWDIDSVFDNSSNKQRLIDEAGDVMAMISIMVENNLLTEQELNDRIDYKKRKLEKWSSLFDEK